jgi:hypothetical protein
MKKILFVLLAVTSFSATAMQPSYKIAFLKYNGGGDWYANLETSIPNLIKFVRELLSRHRCPVAPILPTTLHLPKRVVFVEPVRSVSLCCARALIGVVVCVGGADRWLGGGATAPTADRKH